MPVLLFAFWVILNARLTVEVIVSGVLVTIVGCLLNYRFVGVSWATEKKILAKIFPIIGYLLGLIIEVIKANILMIKMVLTPDINEKIKPQLIYFDSPVRSDIAQVALANSITLTPGTITIKLEDGKFGVHAVDAPLGDGIEDCVFVGQLKKLEGGHDRV